VAVEAVVSLCHLVRLVAPAGLVAVVLGLQQQPSLGEARAHLGKGAPAVRAHPRLAKIRVVAVVALGVPAQTADRAEVVLAVPAR
jgi:hypothetical protein